MTIKKFIFLAASLVLFDQSGQAQKTSSNNKASVKQVVQKPTNQVRVTGYVDPFIGSDHGNTFVGAALPFSIAKPGPDVLPPYNTAGYNEKNKIEGFSQTHLSGTGGGGRYGNVMLSPLVGEPTITNRAGNRSNEVASPGYYAVTVGRKPGDVRTELTLTERCSYHRYRFYTWDKKPKVQGVVMIDPAKVISRKRDSLDSRCTGAELKYNETDQSVSGSASYAGGWGGQNPYKVYFYIKPNKQPIATGSWLEDSVFTEISTEAKGKVCGLYLRYNFAQQEEMVVKVGISFRSLQDAIKNANQHPDFDFDAVRNEADQKWNALLSRIQVSGGTVEQQKTFYTNLYHTFLMPHDHSGESPNWETNEPTFWDHYCMWDVFRAVMPLHTLIAPDQQRRILRSLLDVAKHTGWLPDAWVAGGHGQQQGGTNADVVFADAINKGLLDIKDKPLMDSVWKYLERNAYSETDKPYVYGRQNKLLNQYGFLPADVKCGSSITAEVSYNDFCIGLVAQKLGKSDVAKDLFSKSRRVWNLWKPDTGYLWAKERNGSWAPNFSHTYTRPDSWNGPYFYEGSSWVYSYYMPHNFPELIKKRKGPRPFTAWLDRYFESGYFKLENEPLFYVPYLYNYAGRPDKTAVRVRELMKRDYLPARNGLPGQDDSGALSSWYVWSALGLMPVAGQDFYLLGSPLFDQASIRLEGGKVLSVTAVNNSSRNIYVKSVTLNGVPVEVSKLTHNQIKNGGQLVFTMTDQPASWASKPLDALE